MSQDYRLSPFWWTGMPPGVTSFLELLNQQRTGNPSIDHGGNPVDRRRLAAERAQLSSLRVPVRPIRFPDRSPDYWDAYGADCSYGGFLIRAVYDEQHPYRPPRVTLDPAPSNRHYYNDGRGVHLCYTKPEEWNPRFTMVTTFAVVFRFISDLHHGRAN